MILTCPACGTSYTVKDGAIPPQGRNVRCAACKHSWHQDGEGIAAVEPVEEVRPAQPEAAPDDPLRNDPVEAAIPAAEPIADEADDAPETIAEPAAFVTEPEPAVGGEPELVESADFPPVEQDIDWNDASYDGEEQPAPRRKGLVVVLVLVLVLLVAVLAAAAWFLAPREWMARTGLVAASSDSPLKLMVTSQDRQKLASGNDLVSLSGRVINPTDSTQAVPALQADLRDNGGKLVYSWTIAPPTPRLAPRASASFNAAELGVPADATSLTLRWAS